VLKRKKPSNLKKYMNLKKYLRSFVYNLIAIWFVAQFIKAIDYQGGYQTLLLATLALTAVNFLVKPLIKLLFLPINLITLGAFRWVVNVIALYIVTLLVPYFQIKPIDFPGFSYQGFVVPSFHLSLIWAFIVVSFLLSIITSFLFWLKR
jgi:putative membrane protein